MNFEGIGFWGWYCWVVWCFGEKACYCGVACRRKGFVWRVCFERFLGRKIVFGPNRYRVILILEERWLVTKLHVREMTQCGFRLNFKAVGCLWCLVIIVLKKKGELLHVGEIGHYLNFCRIWWFLGRKCFCQIDKMSFLLEERWPLARWRVREMTQCGSLLLFEWLLLYFEILAIEFFERK